MVNMLVPMPSCLAVSLPISSWSPVIIFTLIPICRRDRAGRGAAEAQHSSRDGWRCWRCMRCFHRAPATGIAPAVASPLLHHPSTQPSIQPAVHHHPAAARPHPPTGAVAGCLGDAQAAEAAQRILRDLGGAALLDLGAVVGVANHHLRSRATAGGRESSA